MKKHPFLPIKNIQFCQKGERAQEIAPGDFILVHTHGILSSLIQFGQKLAYKDKRLWQWNHAALLIDTEGNLIEAQARGIKATHIDKYTGKDYYVVNIGASDEDRAQAVEFAMSCLNYKYGILTFLSIGLSLLTGLRFAFGFDGEEVCSGLVARSLERTSAIFPRDASHIAPAGLAAYYFSQYHAPQEEAPAEKLG